MNARCYPLGFLAVFFITACVGSDPRQQDENTAEARQLSVASQCGFGGPDLVYMDSRSRLEEVGSRRGVTLAPLEDHDFSAEHLLLVAAGRKPTGGYGIALDQSRLHDDVLDISVRVSEPGANQMVTQALTSPCLLLAVPSRGWDRVRVAGPGLPELSVQR
ncbi:PrcB C-terminal [Marinobacter daqiaonensis]|uniref:PrcB C-terminal n=1 Tax=Marinobacter daqiaonensis TaxID=650891 RepID=A0A1I6HE40_9GAMM|nr:protease complex subunit PrcB family protein [Marinobacter daqiaonensis]SFR52752.1 PrcB C-terminal [Marinobacter daqiaonensis]